MNEDAASEAEPVVGRVLVVDDLPANRLLLCDVLEAQGHIVSEAVDGTEALRLVASTPPDVVLLDVQMPGMDGFEVCRRLKIAPDTAQIPVLLVTALSAREHRLEGIRAGANDFITKPIDTADLTLRVRNAVRMRRLSKEVEQQYQRLKELEQLRDALVHMVAHDIRSPLTGVFWALDLLQRGAARMEPESAQAIEDAIYLTHRITDMVSDLLDVSRMESGQMPLNRESLDLVAVAEEMARRARASDVPISCRPAAASIPAHGDKKILGRVIANLLDNAVKFSPRGQSVEITVSGGEDGPATVSVVDAGPGIPPEAVDQIFEKFGQVAGVHQERRSSGLGLTFCKLAVEAHGGSIGVESVVGSGSRFWFELPKSA